MTLFDETVVNTWVENPYWQYFCGEVYLQTEAPIDPSSLTRWRKRIGEEGVETLLMGIAGLDSWRSPKDGSEKFSLAMLTVNTDGHPVMSQFHRPNEEKRMVVILASADYDEWLTCSMEEAPRFFRRWIGPLDTYAAPLSPRKNKTASGAQRPTPIDEQPDDDDEGNQAQLF